MAVSLYIPDPAEIVLSPCQIFRFGSFDVEDKVISVSQSQLLISTLSWIPFTISSAFVFSFDLPANFDLLLMSTELLLVSTCRVFGGRLFQSFDPFAVIVRTAALLSLLGESAARVSHHFAVLVFG